MVGKLPRLPSRVRLQKHGKVCHGTFSTGSPPKTRIHGGFAINSSLISVASLLLNDIFLSVSTLLRRQFFLEVKS